MRVLNSSKAAKSCKKAISSRSTLKESIDGKPFAGGKGENYMLEVGAGQALPQFDEAVVGFKVGERAKGAVNYPENYPNKEIAGKAVDFSIVAREIKQKVLPVLDDEFAKDHGECASLEELKTAHPRAPGTTSSSDYQDEELKEKLISRLIEAHPFAAPPSMVERQTRYLMERYQNQIAAQPARRRAPPPMEEARKNFEAARDAASPGDAVGRKNCTARKHRD